MTEVLAVIELGSGSTRLLIDATAGETPTGSTRFHGATRFHSVTRMSEGLSATGKLSPEALERVELALREFRSHCDDAGVTRTVVVASEAARRASNTDSLQSLVNDIVGVDLEVLSESQEGSAAFAGATTFLPEDSLALVIDIGGASTEFVVGVTGSGHVDVVSIPLGAVSVTDQYIASDPPDPAELSSALSVTATYIEDVIRDLPTLLNAVSHGTVIAVGGTVTTAAAVELGLANYQSDVISGFKLEREAVEDVFRTLATESHADRAHNPGLESDRVSLIVGGICVLVTIMRHLVINDIIVSDNDVLDGIVAERRG